MPFKFGTRQSLGLGIDLLWTPAQLGSALVAWWDAADTDNITLSGASVASWRDKTGNTTLTQATSSARPTWSATARNGKPGVTFVRTSSQTMTATGASLPLGTSPSTIAVAGYGVGSAVNNTFLSYGNAGNGLQRVVGFGNSGTNVWTSTNVNNYNPAVSWSGIDRLVSWQFVPSVSTSVVVDGVVFSGTALPGNTTGTTIMLGALVGIGAFADGTIQHAIIVNRILTVAEQQKLDGWESWIDGKAGANLPADHPYKSRAPLASD